MTQEIKWKGNLESVRANDNIIGNIYSILTFKNILLSIYGILGYAM